MLIERRSKLTWGLSVPLLSSNLYAETSVCCPADAAPDSPMVIFSKDLHSSVSIPATPALGGPDLAGGMSRESIVERGRLLGGGPSPSIDTDEVEMNEEREEADDDDDDEEDEEGEDEEGACRENAMLTFRFRLGTKALSGGGLTSTERLLRCCKISGSEACVGAGRCRGGGANGGPCGDTIDAAGLWPSTTEDDKAS